jgi:hypothetical protein
VCRNQVRIASPTIRWRGHEWPPRMDSGGPVTIPRTAGMGAEWPKAAGLLSGGPPGKADAGASPGDETRLTRLPCATVQNTSANHLALRGDKVACS